MTPGTSEASNPNPFLDSLSANSPFYGLAIGFASRATHDRRGLKSLVPTVGMGLVSFALYLYLYRFEQQVVHFADLARHGDKTTFWVPIAVALLFSLVHGAFTSRFWHNLGLRAKHHQPAATPSA